MVKFSVCCLIIIVIALFLLPLILTLSPYELNANAILLPPSLEHFLGTDRLGRDLFSRVIIGGQTSIIIGFTSALITSLIGLIIGISAGFFKGIVDRGIVIIIDIFLTFPTFFLLLTLVSYIPASSLVLIIVLSITAWMTMARLIRSESFALAEKPYIKVLSLAGVSHCKILFKYFSPLLAPIILIAFTLSVGGAILAESGLSFLGLGINPPHMSWGSLLSDGRTVLDIAWWVSFFPGLMIFIVTFCLMQIADHFQQKINQRYS